MAANREEPCATSALVISGIASALGIETFKITNSEGLYIIKSGENHAEEIYGILKKAFPGQDGISISIRLSDRSGIVEVPESLFEGIGVTAVGAIKTAYSEFDSKADAVAKAIDALNQSISFIARNHGALSRGRGGLLNSTIERLQELRDVNIAR